MWMFDVAIIGGGPAGIAAALEAQKNGCSVVILERNEQLGGILRQCIHSGFGLRHFKEELTGPEYAQRFIDQLKDSSITVLLSTMVLRIGSDLRIEAMHTSGFIEIQASAIVLAMGCRERTRGEIRIPGARIAGVYTAGLAQYYINIENYKPGHRFVILGSGDIGLIMARRLSLEGMEVEGVYELMPYANGLGRNIKNCLEDFNIPLHLSTTVTRVFGKNRVEAVEISQVDAQLRPIPGTQRRVECDTLLLSVGLVPENELTRAAGAKLDYRTGGAEVDDSLQTTIPGIFACGNVLHVHDLVDNVTAEAQHAGRAAAEFAAQSNRPSQPAISVLAQGLVSYTVPVQLKHKQPVRVSFRVRKPVDHGRLTIYRNDELVYQSPVRSFKPSIMEQQLVSDKWLSQTTNRITLCVLPETEGENA